jgi:hypothetical protein
MKNTIIKWLKCLIEKKPIPLDLVSEDFFLEDGMTLQEYWEYEKESFNEYSEIFELNSNFTIEVIHTENIREDVKLVWFYVINSKNRITFKMSISIDVHNKIASNNFFTQFVSKYKIENSQVRALGLAIKSKYPIERILSKELNLEYFSKGANFEEDGFYSANFNDTEITTNKIYTFFVKFANESKIEKRIIFFDNIRFEDKPFILNKNTIETNDINYPVSIALFYKDGTTKVFPYPRNMKFQLEVLKEVIVTDVLDNDWVIKV